MEGTCVRLIRILSWYLRGEIEENHENLQLRQCLRLDSNTASPEGKPITLRLDHHAQR
jgi:hypothetical protein